ncbi:hypothetical protein [Wukongibacter baidiensis]
MTNNINNIMDLINKSTSPFIYHDEVDAKADKNNKNLSKDDVLFLYNQDGFVLSDLHIVKLIAKYTFATQIQIFNAIQICRNKYPDIPLVDDIDGLRNRLKHLTKSALIRRYQFQALDQRTGKLKQQSYYCVSAHGYNYIKRIVNFKDKYDEYIAVTPVDEVFKYLTTGVVIQTLINRNPSLGFKTNKQLYIKELRNLYDIYGEVKSKINGANHSVVIEPFKTRYNKNRMTEEEWKSNLTGRMEFIKAYFTKNSVENIPHVVFACEDLMGLKEAMKTVIDCLEGYLDNVYFTTDAVLFFYGLDKALIKIIKENGKPILHYEENIPFL